MEAVLELVDVHKRYRVYSERYRSIKEILFHRRLGEWEDRWALRGVSFSVDRGSMLGLIGPNGAGKSTALKLLARILVPDSGVVRVGGRVSALLELGAGFQPEYTGRENVFLNASLLGLSRREIQRRFDDIVGFAELESHIDDPVRTYSSGMFMRLGFSVAIHVEPEIMLVDEILAVGDEAFQHRCFDWLTTFKDGGGTLVLVSHNLAQVEGLCTSTAWIEDGNLRRLGKPEVVVGAYLDAVRDRIQSAAPDASGSAISISRVRIVDRQGAEVAEVGSGSSLGIEIDYMVNRRVETPIFAVGIYRSDGIYFHGVSTAGDGFDIGPAGPGPGTVKLTYEALPLLSGTYRVTVAALISSRPNSHPVDLHEQRYSFRVVTGSRHMGAVDLDHSWSRGPAPGQLDEALGG